MNMPLFGVWKQQQSFLGSLLIELWNKDDPVPAGDKAGPVPVEHMFPVMRSTSKITILSHASLDILCEGA